MTLTAGFGLPRTTRHRQPKRCSTKRSYLLCPPTYFDVVYAINDWMHPENPVDTALAVRQWEQLVSTYRALRHEVAIIEPVPGLPDMVFVTDSGLVIDGRVLGARYKTAQRAAEAHHVMRWFEDNGFLDARPSRFVNEGEGDFLVVGDVILAGTGFRTDPRAHAEAAVHLRREVITLNLVDPTYYHLNTALAVLDDRTIAYLPRAFAPDSRTLLQERFPDAIIADEVDTEWLGLNLVSDGRNVVLAAQATGLAERLRERGFVPVPVDFSEFRKAGGGIKCATLELRSVEPGAQRQ